MSGHDDAMTRASTASRTAELPLPEAADAASGRSEGSGFGDLAFSANRTAPVHRWVPWIAGYSSQFVADAIDRHLDGPGRVLDPFAGVGTTLLEADRAGHEAVGFEINPYAAFAARTKLAAHRVDGDRVRDAVRDFRSFGAAAERRGLAALSAPPAGFRTRAPFYSPAVLRKVLLVQDFIAGLDDRRTADLFRLAFASMMVTFSNYSYEPSLGRKVSAGRPPVDDYPVFAELAGRLLAMAGDAEHWRGRRDPRSRPDGQVFCASFFDDYPSLGPDSIDLAITSPPYLNNYHYNRNTRPHLYWLEFCSTPQDFKKLEQQNFGRFWQNAREMEPVSLHPDIDNECIESLLSELRNTNTERGIYGGPGWANYAALYFNDCWRFAKAMKWCLRPGATALVVIGNSILQGIPVPTDRYLAEIAEQAGLEIVDIRVPRHNRVGNSIVNSTVRVGKANGSRLYESVVELRKT